MEFERFLELMRALAEAGVDYILVGAVALNLHGIVRATEDIDLFLRPTPDNVARLKQAFRSLWDDPEIEQITVGDLAGEYPTIRYGPPDETFVVDLLSRLGKTFRYEDLTVQTVMIDGVPIRIATPRTLYRMKRDTIRPIDRADASALREKFALPEEG